MASVVTIGLDIAKSVFHVHGVDAAGQAVVRQRLMRRRVLAFFEKLPRCLVGIEACSSSHYWARELIARGHEVRLMPAQYVKAYVKRGKNGAADAEAICEAVTRPAMRFVPVKTPEQQKRNDAAPGEADAQSPAHPALQFHSRASFRVRHRCPYRAARARSASCDRCGRARPRVPADARLCLQMLAAQLIVVKQQILENDRRVRASARSTGIGRRLMEIPGVGPLLASAFVAAIADPAAFKTGRGLAAWIGLVPKQNSSGGKDRLGSISKAGNRYLRQMLVVGAMAVIRYAEQHETRRPWLVQLMQRRTTKIAAVALANKMARIVWALMTSGERYREPAAAGA
jgi:transposase